MFMNAEGEAVDQEVEMPRRRAEGVEGWRMRIEEGYLPSQTGSGERRKLSQRGPGSTPAENDSHSI